MDKKKSSLGLKLSSKESKTADKAKLFSAFNSPVSNKNTSLYKSVLKESVGKSARSNSKGKFSRDESIKNAPREHRSRGKLEFHCSFDSDMENSPENSPIDCKQPAVTVSKEAILQGVVAYIEARTNTENRFEGISKQMELLGAVVVKKFIPEVTHVIFKDGKKTTREKALKKGIHLVNVLWVESCRESGKRVSEELFPVLVPDEVHTPVVTKKLKRIKSMRPKPFEEDVMNSAERIKRKRKRKMEAEKTTTSILSPLTIRLMSEQDSSNPPYITSPLSAKHVPGALFNSDPNSPEQQDRDPMHTDIPCKRLCFANSFGKKEETEEIRSSKKQDTPHGTFPPVTRVSVPRDAVKDSLFSNLGLSDSGISFSEAETKTNDIEVLKQKKTKRKHKKSEKIVRKTLGIDDQNEAEGKEDKNELHVIKKTELKEEKKSKAKRGKKTVLEKKKEATEDIRYEVENKLFDDVCETSEGNRVENTKDAKKTNPNEGNDISRRRKPVRKKILDDTDDEDEANEDGCQGYDDYDYYKKCGEDNVLNEAKAKQSIGPNKKEKNLIKKKPSRSLVLTSMHCSEQDIVISVVRKLGGFYIADEVVPSTTHVVSGSPRRTLNVLMAIAQGNWLVSPEWVMKSLETGYWVDEEPYELSDAFPSAQLSRLERVSTGLDYQQELFADVDPIFVSENTSPPRDALIKVITLCGGKVCTSIRKAGVCVGSISRNTKAIIVKEAWVLDSITEHVALSFNSYVFNPAKSSSPTY